MRKIKFLILLLTLFMIFSVSLKAEENEVVSEEGQSAPHETGTPLVYYLNWAGLIAMCVIVLREVKNKKSDKKHQEDKKDIEFYEAGSEKPNDPEHKFQKPVLKPVLLILLAVLIFFGEQLPVLSDFHENLAAGYFRFIFKILIGVLMLSYGLSSMEEEHH
ncbi:MAG: hypothetical protein PHX78_04880 [bacterium]|nr:hypothetical protein [bacterium]